MQHVLVLNIPPELEDEVVDYLLSLSTVRGFTSYPVRGHGEQHSLSIAEQVAGRQKRIQFELILPEDCAPPILEGLNTQVGNDIFYWQYPVIRSGHILK